MNDSAKKMERFLKGWDEKASGLLQPDAKYDRVSGKFLTWEEVLVPLTVFEAYKLGQAEGEAYAKSVG